uniref:Uncharacterized protein n=1 Tax=Candidatus Kentrum sp. FW TaxID=2126338 RepID=A0A450TW48_9GAMM|nr:MAG: hypothetical protein BECKFW1821C_GA0114237_104712 [Candidatus Kentron sp. FW]
MANEQLRPPETITLPWLFHHMSLAGWMKFLGMFVAVALLMSTIGYKFSFLPLAAEFGLGVADKISTLEEEISNLNTERSKTNRTLSETNLKLSEEVEKGKHLSEELSKANSEKGFLHKKNKGLESALSEKDGQRITLINALKQQEEAYSICLKKLQICKKSPCPRTPCPVSPPVPEVIEENLVLSEDGQPWISPSHDATLSLLNVDGSKIVTLWATSWETSSRYRVGGFFSISTSSGCYRFIIKDASYNRDTANLRIVRTHAGGCEKP